MDVIRMAAKDSERCSGECVLNQNVKRPFRPSDSALVGCKGIDIPASDGRHFCAGSSVPKPDNPSLPGTLRGNNESLVDGKGRKKTTRPVDFRQAECQAFTASEWLCWAP